jgi:hypothetical protein
MPEIMAEYVQEGKKISNDIKAMFEKQAAEKQLLGFFIQIGSHMSRTPLSRTNFCHYHASPEPLSNLQAVTQA